jgi:glycerophosphoryl diester phosphodiesterase
MRATPAPDLQGHRGARALRPENTLPAFACALEAGITTLELDCAITADGVVVVSHDSVLNPDITRGPEGLWISGPPVRINTLSYDALRVYDVGRIRPGTPYAARFPAQTAIDGTRIPRLMDVFALARDMREDDVRFNIETKVTPLAPTLTCDPASFVDAIATVAAIAGVTDRVTIQSFDWRSIARVKTHHPRLQASCLTSESGGLDNVLRAASASPWTDPLHVAAFDGSLPRMVAAAGARIWSPEWTAVDRESIDEAHALGLEVVVWTVDGPDDIRRFIGWGVDGIISDDPVVLLRTARQSSV